MQRINNKQGLLSQEEPTRDTDTLWKNRLGCLAILFFFLASVRLGAFGKLPTFTDLENPQSNLASGVISSGGKVLGTYFVQNRSNVTFEELSPDLVNALIATEDIRFYR